MCGIFCKLSYSGNSKQMNTLNRIQNRGPDCVHSSHVMLDNNVEIFFYGSVLWMQGPNPYRQPVENNMGVLLFNGDIFDEAWDNSISDTQILMEKLSYTSDSSEQHIIKNLQLLKGPFSIIYYDKVEKNLYFSRDRIGRTSLLCCMNDSSFVLASVLDRSYKCIEVPATHIYKLNLESCKLFLYSWNSSKVVEEHNTQEWIQMVQNQQNIPDNEFTFEFDVNLDIAAGEDVILHIQNTSTKHTCKLAVMHALLEYNVILKTVQKITELLERSIKIRLKKHPQRCKNCVSNKQLICNHCTVGILFSGGLDCTILALLADKYVPKNQPIDLINVAFKMTDNASYDVPDRITGRQSLEELRNKCKTRQWVFREINVPKEKLLQYQSSTIGDLVYPRNTILDESLGSALWFAALGEVNDDVSPCRVVLLGSGADELFGGYVRHRNAFKRNGWVGLSRELMLDWKRISFRNLARDNRVICDHGRQPRMPYLDEDLTEYVLSLNPWMKCFPSEQLPCGIGDKLMLRLVALNIGLTEAVILPKRALQFGSKIANKKENGSDISKTFTVIKEFKK